MTIIKSIVETNAERFGFPYDRERFSAAGITRRAIENRKATFKRRDSNATYRERNANLLAQGQPRFVFSHFYQGARIHGLRTYSGPAGALFAEQDRRAFELDRQLVA